MLLCFEQISDRDVVFNRASCLERTGLMVTDIFQCFFVVNILDQITEDMTRPEREQWGELRKFMVKVKSRYPTSQCFLKKTTLFVDTRMFIWSLEEGRVMEQAIISIPTQAAQPLPRLNVQNRYHHQN